MAYAEKNCKWVFSPREGGVDQGTNDAMGDTFKKLPYDALVRESIQNSLDAAISEDKPVVVTFKHTSADTHNYPNLFKVRENVAACMDFYKTSAAKKRFDPMLQTLDQAWEANRIHYLEVRDENTTGMSYCKGSTDSPFYAFVKSIGNSVKNNKAKGGSHGFGKAAYFNASKIHTVLISTLTESGQYVFEGVSGLCTHVIAGKKREPYGFYTDQPTGDEPITLQDRIPQRFCRKTTGTSVFILGVDHDDKGKKYMKETILKAVVLNFWAAILEGRLIVNMEVSNKLFTINRDNLFNWAEMIYDSSNDTKSYFTNPRPYMDAFYNVGKDFNHMNFEKEMPTLGKVELFMTRTKSGTDNIVCMRSPLMMVEARPNRTNYGFYGVFICRDEKGNEVLRSMEDACHSQWDWKECDDKNDQKLAKLADKEIKSFIEECIRDVFKRGDISTLTFGGLEEFLTIPSTLDDDDRFDGGGESEYGDPNGDRTEKENSEPTTDIDEEIESSIIERDPEGVNGKVIIYEGTNGTASDDGGESDNGDGPKPKPNRERNGEEGPMVTDGVDYDSSDETEEDNSEKRDKSVRPKPGNKDIPGYGSGEGQPMRRTKLNVHYRAFAQACSGGGFSHRLVINSNRESDNAIVQVMCAGESSNEAIKIKRSDIGSCSGNIISNVQLKQGRNVINIWFDDDMRHSITLTVNED